MSIRKQLFKLCDELFEKKKEISNENLYRLAVENKLKNYFSRKRF